jgi:hypothetical protein
MISSRRGFLAGLVASAFAAPAIVRAASLMPVKAMPPVETLEELLRARMDDAYRVVARNIAAIMFGFPVDHPAIMSIEFDAPSDYGICTVGSAIYIQ